MKSRGYLEVIAGPMFSGKTEELIRQIKRATIAKKRVAVFKHKIDTRYGKAKKVYSHAGISFQSQPISNAKDIPKKLDPKTEIVAIDEAQWFGRELVPVIQKLLDRGMHVLVSGLAMTFDREPFPPIPTLMAIADKITKLSAVCTVCGGDAVYHKRIAKTDIDPHIADPSLVGRLESYEARCRRCFAK